MAKPKSGPGNCTVCRHPDKWRIELLRAGGASAEALAEKFGLSKDAIFRHWHNHVHADAKATYLAGPAQMETLHAKAAAEGESVLDYLRIVRTALMASMTACSEAGDGRGVALVASTLVNTLEKIGKVTGEISQIASSLTINNNIAIVNSPQFAKVQAAILRALAPHSAARVAVVEALRELDAEEDATPNRTSGPRSDRQLRPEPILIEHIPTMPPCPLPVPQ
jgi:hypothetical protein